MHQPIPLLFLQIQTYTNLPLTTLTTVMEQRLYKAAALMLTAQGPGGQTVAHRALSEATSVKNLFVQLAGQLLTAAEL